MIISTPLNLPKLEPDDWDKFWNIWETNVSPLVKVNPSPNKRSALHVGFDIFREPWFKPVYDAKHVYLDKIYPELYNSIMSLPVKIFCARFVSSRSDFPPHVDNFSPSWIIRSMFYTENNDYQWYYTDLDNNNPKKLVQPETTNWWAYKDGLAKHGTVYNQENPKILLQIFSKIEDTNRFVENQILENPQFEKYWITYDHGS